MRILAIETSCDETAVALLEAAGRLAAPKIRVVKNLISSQIAIHAPFGGVVPNLAKREHLKNLPMLYRKIFESSKSETRNSKQIQNSKFKIPKIDLIAVTVGPGLEPALWTGIEFAKQIHKELKIGNPRLKLVGVNHLEGHLYSFLLSQKTGISNDEFRISKENKKIKNSKIDSKLENQNSKLFPAIALIVSGGHTILLKMDSLVKWKKLGETRDDAAGEAFDKVARILGLPYPGGPEIQKLAAQGNPQAIEFPRPMIHTKDYNFSYSGLKTSVLYYTRDQQLKTDDIKLKADVAASFQEAALEVLVAKTARAAKEYNAKSVFLSGGVAANAALREKLKVLSLKSKVNFLAPPMDFNTDNAAMIGVAGYLSYLRKKNRKITGQANLSL